MSKSLKNYRKLHATVWQKLITVAKGKAKNRNFTIFLIL